LATFTDNSNDKKISVSGGGYSINNVTTNHAIAATFSLIPAAPVNGSCGTSNGSTFTVAPDNNFCSSGTGTTVIGSGPWNWTCTGISGGTSATCSANKSIQTYTVTSNVSSGTGTISCTPQVVNAGATSICTVTPANGYQLVTFTDNSLDKKASVTGGSYGIANVNANHSISATFSLIPPTPVNGSCGTSNGSTFTVAPDNK
jgi:hypothetical protein